MAAIQPSGISPDNQVKQNTKTPVTPTKLVSVSKQIQTATKAIFSNSGQIQEKKRTFTLSTTTQESTAKVQKTSTKQFPNSKAV